MVLKTLAVLLAIYLVVALVSRFFRRTFRFTYHASTVKQNRQVVPSLDNSNEDNHVELTSFPLFSATGDKQVGMIYNTVSIYPTGSNYQATYVFGNGSIHVNAFMPGIVDTSVFPDDRVVKASIVGGSGEFVNACGTITLVTHTDGEREVTIELKPRWF